MDSGVCAKCGLVSPIHGYLKCNIVLSMDNAKRKSTLRGKCKLNEHSTWIVKNELSLFMDSWTHYVWINYYSQIVHSTIHEALT